MLVKRLKPLPIEAVVRGYLAGSGWKEYQESGAVCGVMLPPGPAQRRRSCRRRSSRRRPRPRWATTTRTSTSSAPATSSAPTSPRRCATSRSASTAKRRRSRSTRGIVIADTKFEFGLDDAGTLTLMDEVLTPDSSRFWPAASVAEGSNPPSLDKQSVRDWLEQVRVDGAPWNKKPPAPPLPAEVVAETAARYRAALDGLGLSRCSARPRALVARAAQLTALPRSSKTRVPQGPSRRRCIASTAISVATSKSALEPRSCRRRPARPRRRQGCRTRRGASRSTPTRMLRGRPPR